jgi:ABC-type ATPase with predicted acetyltransferase domain
MVTFQVQKELVVPAPESDRARALCRALGCVASRARCRRRLQACRLRADAGDVVFITGASGSGKSCLLAELREVLIGGPVVTVGEVATPTAGAVIDAVAGSLVEALRILATAGLSDVYTLLQSPPCLSTGEAYRLRLALALAMRPAVLCADDFGRALDPITSAVVAARLRDFATRSGTLVILASTCTDCLADLQPDVIVETQFDGPAEVTYKTRRTR